jgi:hypothetical protein
MAHASEDASRDGKAQLPSVCEPRCTDTPTSVPDVHAGRLTVPDPVAETVVTTDPSQHVTDTRTVDDPGDEMLTRTDGTHTATDVSLDDCQNPAGAW